MPEGDLRWFDPGEQPQATLVADSKGTVADRGDIVQLVGGRDGFPYVKLVEDAGAGIGALVERPVEYDPAQNYAAGDVVGDSNVTLLTLGPIDWYEPSGSYTPTINDLVVADAGGTVRKYDAAGGDTPDMIYGRVFATGTQATPLTADKAAILRGD